MSKFQTVKASQAETIIITLDGENNTDALVVAHSQEFEMLIVKPADEKRHYVIDEVTGEIVGDRSKRAAAIKFAEKYADSTERKDRHAEIEEGEEETEASEKPIEAASEVIAENNPAALPEEIVITTEDSEEIAIPEGLEEVLQPLYRSATPEERTAFDKLVASAAAKPKKSTKTKAQNQAGVTAFEAFIVFLFESAMTLDQMVDQWEALSGQGNKRTTFATYLNDVKKGKYVPKAYKGSEVNIVKDEDKRYSVDGETPQAYQELLDRLGEEEIQRIVTPIEVEGNDETEAPEATA